jgi:CheY-like chemotaxis protein
VEEAHGTGSGWFDSDNRRTSPTGSFSTLNDCCSIAQVDQKELGLSEEQGDIRANHWHPIKVTYSMMTKKKRLLIVEDNEHVRNTLYSWLSLSFPNCDVDYRTSGEDALKYVDAEKPDIILMDIGLPGISGLETMRKIKTDHQDIAIIIISIHETPEYQVDAKVGGALAFIPKHRMYVDLNPLIKDTLKRMEEQSTIPAQT